MPDENKPLTKRQASIINKNNRKISGNINALMDELNSMTHGTKRTDKINDLVNNFNSLMKNEIENISRASDGDTTSFITKLYSENNKRLANSFKDLENVFNADQGQLEAFMAEKYRNRLIKQADLQEVSEQLVELREAVQIIRDAITSSDTVDGQMNRTIKIENDDMNEDRTDYVPIVEEIEKKFELQKKIKNFIIPRSLEFGEYYVYHIPYSKVFEDFSKEKNSFNGKYMAYSENTEKTLYEFVNSTENSNGNNLISNITNTIFESIQGSNIEKAGIKKEINLEVSTMLQNISVNNTPIPLPILEEGVDTSREYYNEFVTETIGGDFFSEDNKNNKITFDNVINKIDSGVHVARSSFSKKQSKGEKFNNVKDCYIKLMDPMHLLPIEIMSETIGYYYIQEEDITPLSGMLTSTVYYSKYDDNRNDNNVLSSIAETIVSAFDKKFLEKNMKFKKLIVEALNYFKLNNRKIKFQFIPKEYISPFIIDEDENGHGTSVIEPSLFYAKLYLMLLLFKIMSIILYSNDTRVNYIRNSGIEKNITNKIQEIARKKQQRQITLADMFSYTTLINKIGQGSEMYIPVGKSNERGIETEILSGQDVQLNNDLMEAYISGTGVPDVLMNYIHEAEFAKTLELANTKFHSRVVSYQLDYNKQITNLYKNILKYSSNIPEHIIDTLEFSFSQPRYSNANVTNELISNHNTLSEFLVSLYFDQNRIDDPDVAPCVQRFKRGLAENRLTMINFAEIDNIFKDSKIKGTEDALKTTDDNSEE